jgi:uncharacterized membrane protein (DUF106 family)
LSATAAADLRWEAALVLPEADDAAAAEMQEEMMMLIPNQTNRLSRRNDTSGFLPLMVIVVIVLPVWKWLDVFAKTLSDLQRTDVDVGKQIFPLS